MQLQAQSPTEKGGWLADLRSRIQIHGFAQGGFTYSKEEGDPTAIEKKTFELKRVILLARAQITDKWSFLLMHEPVSGKWQEYYTEYRFGKAFGVRLGQMKNLLTIENPIIPTALELIALNSQATAYMAGVAGDAAYGAQIGRDLGVMVYGDLLKDHLRYELGLFNGQGINVKDGNNYKDFQGRLTIKASNALSFATTWQIGKGHAIAQSQYVRQITEGMDYTRNRWTIGGVADYRGIYLRSEFMIGKDGPATSRGFYAVLRVRMGKRWDVIGSYDTMNYNTSTGCKKTNYIAGLQYWFYKDCRLQAQYTRGDDLHKLELQTQISF